MAIMYKKLMKKFPNHQMTHKEKLFIEALKNGRFKIDFRNGIVYSTCTNRPWTKIGKSGYIDVAFKHDNSIYHMLAHRLIYLAKYGSIPSPYMLNHIDGNKANNKMSNLEIVTQSENTQHAFRTGLIDTKKVSNSLRSYYENNINNRAKFTKQQVYDIIQWHQLGLSSRKIGKMYHVGHDTILEILQGKSYKLYTNGKPYLMTNPRLDDMLEQFDRDMASLF